MREPQQSWPQFRRVASQARRLDDVVNRLGIDALAVARMDKGHTYAAARRACLECTHDRRCGIWLDASIILEAPPLFCPNAAVFSAVRSHDRQIVVNAD